MSRLLRREWPLFIVVAVVLVWGWEIVLGQVPAWGATYLQFQPWWHAVAEAYRAGRLPLWNPYAGFGAPLAANPQAAAFSPFVLLAVVFGTAHGLGISLLLHSLLAGAGAYFALRRFGAEPESAALAGVILPLCGALAPRAVFPPFFNTACWIGLAVAVWPRRGRLRLWHGFAAGVVLALAWLDGHPQAWLLVLAGSAFAALSPFDWRSGGRALADRLLLCIGVPVAVWAVLAAVQILPAIAFVLHTSRSAGLRGDPLLAYDPPLTALLLLVFPGFFGRPAAGDYLGSTGFWEWSWYVGMTALPLAWLGWRRDRRSAALFCIGLGLAFLPGLPVAGGVVRLLEGGDLLRGPGRYLLLADFALAWAAALGLDALRESRRVWLATLAVAAGLVIGGAVALATVPGLQVLGARVAAQGVLLGVAGLAFRLVQFVPVRLSKVIIVAVAAAGLLMFARPLLPLADARVYQGPTPLAGTLFTPESIFLQQFFAAFPLASYTRRAAVPETAKTLPNRGTLLGYRDVLPYDPLVLSDVNEALNMAVENPQLRYARLGINSVADRFPALPDALPRYALVSRYEIEPDTRAALLRLFDPTFNATSTVVLASRPSPAPGEPSRPGEVQVVEEQPGSIVLCTQSDAPSVLRVLNQRYPGWLASIDGTPTALLDANGIFQAAAVPAGVHTIRLEYRPALFVFGAVISGIGWLAAGSVLVWRLAQWRRGRSLSRNGHL